MAGRASVGFIGLGKLGLPCAAAVSASTGNPVFGFDLDSRIDNYIHERKLPYVENLAEEFLEKGDVRFESSPSAVVQKSDIVFLAIQTPHQPRFEGSAPVPDDTEDFDYSFLVSAVKSVVDSLLSLPEKEILLVVISTVLPGTMRRLVLPLLEPVKEQVSLCYNPFFIAMGNTIEDFLNPEFVLIGSDDRNAAKELANFYSSIHSAPARLMQIESAELTKVAYNTFIGFKIAFANTLGEIVQVRGGDVDEVTSALASANERLMSPKYMSAGMSDGGGCHPRDQIAMSWLAKDANLSSDIFGFLARSRDSFSKSQAIMIQRLSVEHGLRVCLLGLSYKKNIGLTVGSPAKLLSVFLTELGVVHDIFDPFVFPDASLSDEPQLFFVSTNHDVFHSLHLPEGSVVIDPWGNSVRSHDGISVIRPGRDSITHP